MPKGKTIKVHVDIGSRWVGGDERNGHREVEIIQIKREFKPTPRSIIGDYALVRNVERRNQRGEAINGGRESWIRLDRFSRYRTAASFYPAPDPRDDEVTREVEINPVRTEEDKPLDELV